jgi:hypothetical protein
MFTRLLTGLVVLTCVGCAGPIITSRPVQSDPTWLIRLDTFADARESSVLHYNHPAEMAESELAAILSRLMVREQVGLLDQKPAPQPLFSSQEIKQLVPGLQKALRLAKLTEWVVFSSVVPTATTQEVTSGGLFLQEGKLHVVIANYRTQIQPGLDSTERARTNPLRSLGGKGVVLSFDPLRYVITTQANWMGGSSGTPASEVMLDHTAFLADARPALPPPITAASPTAIETTPGPPQSLPSAGLFKTDANEARDSSPKGPAAGATQKVERLGKNFEDQESEIAELKARFKEFDLQKKELERLRQTAEEQDKEIKELKTRLSELEMTQGKPPKKKPTR